MDMAREAMLEMLRLQIEWGADEALLDAPQDRRAVARAVAPVMARPALVPPALVPPALIAQPVLAVGRMDISGAEAAELAAACDDLPALRAALEGFTACALRETATQLVFADGAEDARLMIIGEAPGAEEDRSGRPFVGPAGQLLDKMLASIGLDRTRVRIVNTVPWRPPGNRAPSDAEIAQCLPFLHRHIALIKPDFLLLLGGVASKAMTGESQGIKRLRGRWQHLTIPGLAAPLPALPSYHPAYLLRSPSAKRESWIDLLTVRASLEAGIIPV